MICSIESDADADVTDILVISWIELYFTDLEVCICDDWQLTHMRACRFQFFLCGGCDWLSDPRGVLNQVENVADMVYLMKEWGVGSGVDGVPYFEIVIHFFPKKSFL